MAALKTAAAAALHAGQFDLAGELLALLQRQREPVGNVLPLPQRRRKE